MQLDNHHVLITGGTSGIGLVFAKRFIQHGSEVLAVDYSQENIDRATAELPALKTYKADLSNAEERQQLADWVADNFSELDIILNDAGIQHWVNFNHLTHDWAWYHQELAINLEAQLHLTLLFLPTITAAPNGAIINVSSGLVINPGAWVPIYAASKAGVHAFTETLRLQLEDLPTHVFEILPPAVDTSLGGESIHSYGSNLDEFADAVFEQLLNDEPEITFSTSQDQLHADKKANQQQTIANWHLFKDNPTFKNA